MSAKKGQTFNRYSEETKKEAVRLRVVEHWPYSRIMEKLGIKSESQIITWVRKHQNGESLEDFRGRWTKKHFSSAKKRMPFESAGGVPKKLNPNLHGREAGFRSPVQVISKWAPVTWLCRIAEISRAGYYKWGRTLASRMKRADRDAVLKAHILGIHRNPPLFWLHAYANRFRKRRLGGESQEGTPLNERELRIRSVIRKKRPFADRKPSVLLFYNEQRFQNKLGDLSPIEFREKVAA